MPTCRLIAVILVGFTLASAAAAEDPGVALGVGDSGFSPAEVKVPARSRVRLEVTNRSTAAIEFESFELNRERVVQPGQTVSVYVSGLEPGRYEFFDDFHQERRGVLVVE
jgi:hypothetical protein